jgi:hypothetical protein
MIRPSLINHSMSCGRPPNQIVGKDGAGRVDLHLLHTTVGSKVQHAVILRTGQQLNRVEAWPVDQLFRHLAALDNTDT